MISKTKIKKMKEGILLNPYGFNLKFLKKLRKISLIIAFFVFIAAAGGLFIDNLYLDPLYIVSQARGQDLITAFLVVPLQIYAIEKTIKNGRKSIKWFMVWAGCLLYNFYTYMLYIFLSTFNRFFLLYEAIAGLSFYTLLSLMSHLDYGKESSLQKVFPIEFPCKKFIIYFWFIDITFLFAWTSDVLPAIISGVIPEGIELYNQDAVYSMDYVFLLPLIGITAWKLHKRELLGYVLAGIVMIKAFTLGLAIVFMGIFMYFENQPLDFGMMVIFAMITIISVYLLKIYYANLKLK